VTHPVVEISITADEKAMTGQRELRRDLKIFTKIGWVMSEPHQRAFSLYIL
jgi:hypothetical protein